MKKIMSIALTIIAVGAALLVGQAKASEQLDAKKVLQDIEEKGATTVFGTELTGKKWLTLLSNVETGKNVWLKVAVAIYPATDAGPAEDLTLAVSEALLHSPREVLLIAAPIMGINGICDYSEMTMAHRKIQTIQQATLDIDARLNVLRNIGGSDIAEQRKQCLAILEEARHEIQSGK